MVRLTVSVLTLLAARAGLALRFARLALQHHPKCAVMRMGADGPGGASRRDAVRWLGAVAVTTATSLSSSSRGPSFAATNAAMSTTSTGGDPAKAVSREFVSGLAGGAAQRLAKDLVLHPIDTVKTRLQRSGSRRLTRRALADPYAGVLAPLLVGVPAGALFFGVKDATAATLKSAREQNEGSFWGSLLNEDLVEILTVAIANAPYWLVRAPAELVKTRQQLDDAGVSGVGLARRVLKTEGVKGLYVGAREAYANALPTDLVKFYVYRRLKKTVKVQGLSAVANKAVLGSLASATAQVCTTPLDVVKTRAMDAAAEPTDLSIPARASKIARDEGPGALFAGITPRVLRGLVSGGLQFGSYELTKRLFGSTQT